MKISFSCDVLFDNESAQKTHTLELFKNLRKRDDIDIFCFIPKSSVLKSNSKKIICVPTLIRKFPYLLIFYQFILAFYFIHYLIKEKTDVIYARQSSISFSPYIISKIFNIPLIVEINGLLLDEISTLNHSKLEKISAMLSETLNYIQAKKIVAVTQGVKEGIKELYNIPDEKIVVIENGANTGLFRPRDIKEVRKDLDFNQDTNYVCFVGILAPWQGVEYLIQAAPLILNENPNTNFLIVGDGQMKEELMKLAQKTGVSDKFIFTGAVPYEEVPRYINASDVCVAPFVRERNERIGLSPLKIYEYLACGKPVVSSRIPNLEFIEQNNAGILVEPENPEELAKAILKLLRDEKLREELGRNGREYVVKNHSWENVAKRVAEVCKSAVIEHKNKRG